MSLDSSLPQHPRILLASGSPRRQQLLSATGIAFEVVSNPTDEAARAGETPRQQVIRLARGKLANARVHYQSRGLPILTADTLLSFRGEAIGKQASAEEALRTYRRLSGSSHEVLTACSLWIPGLKPREVLVTEVSRVHFLPWDEQLYRNYLSTGEWNDAAGGYRIQETGRRLVERISGSWSNVMGLPLPSVYGMILRYLSSRVSREISAAAELRFNQLS